MQAAWFDEFGAASEVLTTGEQPLPEVETGQVLVRVHASGVNPSDVKKRAGSFPDLLDNGFVIPHSDGAGVIEAAGSGVPDSRVGERVWVYQAQYGRRFGTAAEYVAIDSVRAVPLPDDTSFDIGACLGIPAMTAHRCVFADGSVEDRTVLVTGGAGRVGYYAIQWAKQAGATVIATASNPADESTCRDAGAASVVNHRESNWSNAVLDATGGQPVDRVVDVDFGANLSEVLKIIRTSGTIASYASMQNPEPTLPFLQMMYKDLTVRLVIVYAMPEEAKEHAVTDINEKLASSDLQHRVAHMLPLSDIAKAHELIEQGGFRGCVLVNLV